MDDMRTGKERENGEQRNNPNVIVLTKVTQEELFNEFLQNENQIKRFGSKPRNYTELRLLDDTYQSYLRHLMVDEQIDGDQFDELVQERCIMYKQISRGVSFKAE